MYLCHEHKLWFSLRFFWLPPPFLRLCFVSPFLFCGFIFQLAALFDRVKRNGPKIKWREMEFELFHTIETVLFVSLHSSLLLFLCITLLVLLTTRSVFVCSAVLRFCTTVILLSTFMAYNFPASCLVNLRTRKTRPYAAAYAKGN